MAKRKKTKNSKRNRKAKSTANKDSKKKDKKQSPEGFWHQATAIFLILLAVLILFGSFGSGGSLAVNLYDWSSWLLGEVAYIVPVVLIATAIMKIRSETNRLERSMFWGLVIFMITTAGFAHLFIDSTMSQQAVDDGTGGGMIGHVVTGGVLGFLNTVTGGLVLFFLALTALHFVFKLPFTYFFDLLGLSKRKRNDVEDEGAVNGKKSKFTLNEGVPLQKGPLRGLKPKTDDQREALTTIGDDEWNLPPLSLLDDSQDKADAGDIEGIAGVIKSTMSDFNIEVEMQGANVGPRVTQYTLKPPSGVRLTKITALENNLALNLAATSIRMEAPIPGKQAVGIEVPNKETATVRLHSILDSDNWRKAKSPLSIAVGKNIAGDTIVADLDSMPHLLIAGATGTGKSVMINSVLISLLYRNSPSDLKLILVDPKEVELSPYNDIPHLLTQVITDPAKCISALKWATAEMDRRYSLLREAGKRDIAGYNALKKEEGMPYIVIVIDELADLMMLAARDVESLIVRIAQKARAVGIHLVLATQRPDSNIITGLIKANVPGRIAFRVLDQVNSRIIIDGSGAEKLLGTGDMLMTSAETPKPTRIQGALVEGGEVDKVADFIRDERAPQYDDEIISQKVNLPTSNIFAGSGDNEDSLYDDAVQVVLDAGKASTSLLQRRLRIGYSRAARLVESLEERGVIGPADGSRPREVLVSSIQDMDLPTEDSRDAADELEVDEQG